MFKIDDNELLKYIKEDVPYLDLTTHIQDIEGKKARLEIVTREDVLVSCMEEACRIAELLGCRVESFIPSRKEAKAGDVVLSFSGDYNDVHKAWRSSQVVLEYSCKIATYTYEMKKEMQRVNKHCELLTTRKTYPFAKSFCIKSVLSGGAVPHRLNLGETILFFDNHRIVYNSNEEFYKQIESFKLKAPEKKVVVESHTLEDAKALMINGADVLQMDKVEVGLLEKVIAFRDKNFKDIKILAAGGVGLENVAKFASTGVDGIVTSKMYLSGMANMGTKIEIV